MNELPSLSFLLVYNAAFVLYLLFARAPLATILNAVTLSLGIASASVAIILLPAYLFLPDRAQALATLCVAIGVVSAPIAVWRFARDRVVPRIPLLEVILINIVALFAAAPGLAYWLDPLLLLLGERVFSSRALGFVHFLLQLWPTWLALGMLRRGPPGDARLRLLLAFWTVVTSAWILVGPAARALLQFDGSSATSLAMSLVASLLAVHVGLALLGVIMLLRSGEGLDSKPELPDELRFFAGRVYVGKMVWISALLLGAAVYVLLRWLFGPAGVWPRELERQVFAAAAAVALARVLMPEPAGGESPETIQQPERLRSFAGQTGGLFFVLLAFGVLLLLGWAKRGVEWVHTPFSWLPLGAEVIRFVAGAVIIVVLLGFVFTALEALGSGARDWKRLRFKSTIACLLALALYQYATMPRQHWGPEVSQETQLVRGRIYVRTETGDDQLARKVLYLEWGGERRALCDRRNGENLVSVRLVPRTARGERIAECYWPSHWARVAYPDVLYEVFASLPAPDAAAQFTVRAVTGNAAPCHLVEPATVVCDERPVPLDLDPDRVAWPYTAWQPASAWRNNPAGSATFVIDTPAGQYWCGRVQAYTGRLGQPPEWTDVVLVAPAGEKLESYALWGINSDGQARCEDVSWIKNRNTGSSLRFRYGDSWFAISARTTDPEPSVAARAPAASSAPTAPSAPSAPRVSEDPSMAPLPMRAVAREQSPCRLVTDPIPADAVLVCKGRNIVFSSSRTGFPNGFWDGASRYREVPGGGEAFIIDSPAGQYWCGRAQAYASMSRGWPTPRWIDVILVAPVEPVRGERPFWGVNDEREARCDDLRWNKARPRDELLGVKFYYGKVGDKEIWFPVPPPDPFDAPLPMRKVSRNASPCHPRMGPEPAILCRGREIPLDRRMHHPNPDWDTATGWRESPDPGDAFVIDSPAGEYWCGRLQAYAAPRIGPNEQGPREWVDVIVIVRTDARPGSTPFWGLDERREARCETFYWSKGLPGIAFPYERFGRGSVIR